MSPRSARSALVSLEQFRGRCGFLVVLGVNVVAGSQGALSERPLIVRVQGTIMVWYDGRGWAGEFLFIGSEETCEGEPSPS